MIAIRDYRIAQEPMPGHRPLLSKNPMTIIVDAYAKMSVQRNHHVENDFMKLPSTKPETPNERA